ncbi:MAG: type II secretion system F family protein [Candidatus Micrarchaeota archaeon]|nr:type II secretion system F family protein [Candidatus Micrarchaeota archaeon]
MSYILPGLEYDLDVIGSDITKGEYVAISIANAIAWALIIFLLLFALSYAKGNISLEKIGSGGVLELSFLGRLGELVDASRWTIMGGMVVFFVFFSFFSYYPRILARKTVEDVDKDLVYALKDLLLQISSGVPLFDAMVNISKSGYGVISKEFRRTVQDINAGEMQERALEKMALRTESEFLRRTIRQILTAFKSGASLQAALKSVIRNLQQYQYSQVKSYTYELNLWVLLFVIISVAIPSLGITLLVILSTFGSISINEGFILGLLAFCIFCEVALVEFIKSRRPVTHM